MKVILLIAFARFTVGVSAFCLLTWGSYILWLQILCPLHVLQIPSPILCLYFFPLFFFFLYFILFIYLFIYTAGSYQLSILYTLVYICQSQSPNSSHHHSTPTFPSRCPYVGSLHLCLYFCLANRFICTIFLDSTYMH